MCSAQKCECESEDLASIFSFLKSSHLILGKPHNFSETGLAAVYLTVNLLKY